MSYVRRLPILNDDGSRKEASADEKRFREVRPIVEKMREVSDSERAIMRAEGSYVDRFDRPKTRRDCLPGGMNAARPCPWVSCKHSLFLDVNKDNGNIKLNFPDLEPHEMAPGACCALDVAETNESSVYAVAELTNITHVRVRQIELGALRRLEVAASEDASLAWRDEFLDYDSHGRRRSVSNALSEIGESFDGPTFESIGVRDET